MNILHVINSSNPAGGGPIESIAQAHLALHQAGHRFEIVCLDPPDAAWLKNFPLSVHATGPALSRYRYSPRLVPWIRAHAARFERAYESPEQRSLDEDFDALLPVQLHERLYRLIQLAIAI